MKKLKMFSLLLLVSIISTMFVGCSSDDDESGSNSDNAISLVGGSWIYSVAEGSYEKFEFYADGTCLWLEFADGDVSDKGFGKYSIKGDKLTMILTFGDETEKWSYTIDTERYDEGKLLILIDEDGEVYELHYWRN